LLRRRRDPLLNNSPGIHALLLRDLGELDAAAVESPAARHGPRDLNCIKEFRGGEKLRASRLVLQLLSLHSDSMGG
jgi:hypothetical protein